MVKVGKYNYEKSTRPDKKLMVVVEKDGKKRRYILELEIWSILKIKPAYLKVRITATKTDVRTS